MAAKAQAQFDPTQAFDLEAMMASWSASHRELANRVLAFYEKAVSHLTDAHVKTARAVDVPAVINIAETQAALTREMAETYVSSARKLLEY
jgi:hypothetical protein